MLVVMLINDEGADVDLIPSAVPVGVNAANEHMFDVPALQSVPEGYRAATIQDMTCLAAFRLKKERISADRDAAIEGGAFIPGLERKLDTDQKSVQRISGATVIAILPVLVALLNREYARAKAASDTEGMAELEGAKNAFKTGWIDADNEVFEMGFEELVAISPALGQHEKEHVFAAFEKKAGLADEVLAAFNAVADSDEESDVDAVVEAADEPVAGAVAVESEVAADPEVISETTEAVSESESGGAA